MSIELEAQRNGLNDFVLVPVYGFPNTRGAGTMNKENKFTVVVEGNIGCGKTTLLKYFSEYPDTQVYPEPVGKWRDVKGHNLLQLMYEEPERWSLTFQTYVQLTMLDTHRRPNTQRLKMMERSIYSAKYCFVENLHRSGKMPDCEFQVLSEWYDWIIKEQDVKIDLIVYLQTRPETVYKRICQRSRKEERNIPLEYLETLHALHEDWLIHEKEFSLPAPVLVLDANGDLESMKHIYEKHSKRILHLEQI